MELNIRKIGNSKGLIIPVPLLDMLNLTNGRTVDASVAGGEMRLKPLPQGSRVTIFRVGRACGMFL